MQLKYAYIDDSADDREYFTRKFPDSHVIKDPKDLQAANDNIDVYLIDVFLKQPGIQLDIVKNIRSKSDKPIIFVSGIDQREADNIKPIFDKWGCGFIEKPVTEDKIQEELCRLKKE
jgi:hypothetical protein